MRAKIAAVLVVLVPSFGSGCRSEDRSEGRIAALEARVAELERVQTQREAEIEDPSPERVDQPRIDGKVLRLDRGTQLIEIDRGTAQGVTVGHQFDIIRGPDFICTVVVDRVDADRSVASIRIRTGRVPEAGDRATTLTSVAR